MNTDKNHAFDIQILDKRLGNTIPLFERKLAKGITIDLMACILDDIIIQPAECVLIPTGISINIHTNEWATVLMPSTGFGFVPGIILGNMVRHTESDCNGHIYIPCWNLNSKPYTLVVGRPIARLVVMPVTTIPFNNILNNP